MATLLALTGMTGLYVDCGHYSSAAHRWVREPYAELTCRAGCAFHAAGAGEVARFCRDVTARHLANCPARKGTP
jgi:hypothetical protein